MQAYCMHYVFVVRTCHDPGNDGLDTGRLPASGHACLSLDGHMRTILSAREEHIQAHIQIDAEVIETAVTQHIDKTIRLTALRFMHRPLCSSAQPNRVSDARSSH